MQGNTLTSQILSVGGGGDGGWRIWMFYRDDAMHNAMPILQVQMEPLKTSVF